MRCSSIISFLILISNFIAITQAEASLFFRNCKPLPGSACGACEPILSARIGTYTQNIDSTSNGTIEGTIKDLKNIILEESIVLGAKQLNWFVAPYSRSLIQPSPEFPKIIIKSPNAEVWMAYGTDPKNEHYQSVEIMRWLPGKAKFEFTLIERNPNSGKLTVDSSGRKCIQCHTSRLRPVWDSYKSWPGLAPARDDLLEVDPRDPSKLEPMSEYYLSFLEKIREPRPSDDRLAELASPFGSMTAQQIRESHLNRLGYLRIPHFPNPKYNFNFSKKTAKLAGPSHLAFDQLEALNLCSAADEIRKKSLKVNLLSQISIATGWKSNDQPRSKIACSELRAGADCPSLIDESIRRKNIADQWNTEDRIVKQKSAYRSLQHPEAPISESDLNFWTKDVKRTLPIDLAVISDPGGVLPVAEADHTAIAALQYILKGTGVNLEEWSMSDAPANSPNTQVRISFSDQFSSILTKINWLSFEVPTLSSIPTRFPNLVEMNVLSLDASNADLSVIQIRDEQFSALGHSGELLARSILIPDQNNSLDNPLFALKVEGKTAVALSDWLNQNLTARLNNLIASSNSICNGSQSCYVLLAKVPIEEFRNSRRLFEVLK